MARSRMMMLHSASAVLVVVLLVAAVASVCDARPPLGFSQWQSSQAARLQRQIERQQRHTLSQQRHTLDSSRPGVQNCTEYWFTQRVDHFNWDKPSGGAETFQQRYYVCDLYWKNTTISSRRGHNKLNKQQQQHEAGTSVSGPIFFYTGNEGDVLLYLNNTGLMWESAPMFGALLVFAEHRYYGQSLPFGNKTEQNMSYLTSEQALADYATLVAAIKKSFYAENSPVIAFGGSYGGMLASWARLKYPSAFDGAIAASAPILAFLGLNPPYDDTAFYSIVTRDASSYAGAPNQCYQNVRAVWNPLFQLAKTADGRKQIQDAFRLCEPPEASYRGYDVADWIQSAWSYLAMGNYPYPSSYITNGDGVLPAFPVRVACQPLSQPFGKNSSESLRLMTALGQAVGVFYNATGTMTCYDINGSVNNDTANDSNFWGYQWCTEMVQPFASNGVTDMFYPLPFNLPGSAIGCKEQWNVVPRPLWITINYGGWRIEAGSNIVWSNGDYDPWMAGGVTRNISATLNAYIIAGGAHHLDLMWSNPQDPQSVLDVRQQERNAISQWIEQAYQRTQQWLSASQQQQVLTTTTQQVLPAQ